MESAPIAIDVDLVLRGCAFVLLGCALEIMLYRRDVKRDEKRMSELVKSWGEDKRYRVKHRPIWKNSGEDHEMIITFDPVMAPDKDKADYFARTYLDERGMDLTFELLEVTEISKT